MLGNTPLGSAESAVSNDGILSVNDMPMSSDLGGSPFFLLALPDNSLPDMTSRAEPISWEEMIAEGSPW